MNPTYSASQNPLSFSEFILSHPYWMCNVSRSEQRCCIKKSISEVSGMQLHPRFPRTRQQVAAWATWLWLSAHLCQADTEKMTVKQLTLYFLGRHAWEIEIAASAAYNVPHRAGMCLYACMHARTVSHRSAAAPLTTAHPLTFSHASRFSYHFTCLQTMTQIKKARKTKAPQQRHWSRLGVWGKWQTERPHRPLWRSSILF